MIKYYRLVNEGASAEDEEQEVAAGICESEVLSPQSILGGCEPLLQSILDNYHRYSPQLQSATALALSKLMLVSWV